MEMSTSTPEMGRLIEGNEIFGNDALGSESDALGNESEALGSETDGRLSDGSCMFG